ncbi:MAG: proline dehydrogenase family protein [Bryobacteraceae bacterium]
MSLDHTLLEQRIQRFGREVFEQASRSTLSVFDPGFYTGKLMDWSMQDEEFKLNLFRFVDVFPSLGTAAGVVRHAQEYFAPVASRIPGLLRWGLDSDPESITARVGAKLIEQQMRQMAGQFIVGENGKDALKALRQLRRNGFAFTADLLGEVTVSEVEADEHRKSYFELMDSLAKEVPGWRESKPLVEGHRGERSSVHVSIKLTALYSQAKPVAHRKSVELLTERVADLVRHAQARGVAVTLDMEDTSMLEIIFDVFRAVASMPEFRENDRLGVAMQAYLRRSEADLEALAAFAKSRGTPIALRLVKGAYWDTETIQARQRTWPSPVWEEKRSTDACYERMALRLFEHRAWIYPAFASHSLRSLSFIAMAAEAMGVAKTEFEFQALYGMAEPLQAALAQRGYLVRDYAPVGELLPGMSYLVRRLLENTSNEGFIRKGFWEHRGAEQLLEKPEPDASDTGQRHLDFDWNAEFHNAPNADFSLASVRDALEKQIAATRARLAADPVRVQSWSGGRWTASSKHVATASPEDPDTALGHVEMASEQMARDAVKALASAFPSWRDTPAADRISLLLRTADILERRRCELTALIVLEAGKPWMEADADVSEAVDFCRYYAIEARKLAQPRRLGELPGELNLYFYEPRGVTVVIAPWNFPIAISCGMFAASLVMGNTTLLKPAEQSSLIARALFEAFLEAGMPAHVAAFLPGVGEDVGPALVRDPAVATIAFTGSMNVGLLLGREAAATSQGAAQVKRVIAEMGGKNAIIVDEGADLDEAVRGVIYSAFGYSGQKCSACSRAIVVESMYAAFLERLREGVRSIVVGSAADPATLVGPVIDRDAQQRLLRAIDEGSRRGHLLVQGGPAPARGYYVPPTVICDLPAGDPILAQELFGPVLAVIRARDFGQALEIAGATDYALTGAVYSRSPRNIERAVREFRVGNLYINRPSTGALVWRQPFGGFRMSGVGSKAGGPDYLLQFAVPRAVSENTLRRGFAPSERK